MSNTQFQKIFAQLKDHEKRIRVLEGTRVKDIGSERTRQARGVSGKSKGEDLFPPVQRLLESGFFKDLQTDIDVCNVLTVRLLTQKKPLRASVVNVLRTLVRKGALTRGKVQRGKREVFAYKEP